MLVWFVWIIGWWGLGFGLWKCGEWFDVCGVCGIFFIYYWNWWEWFLDVYYFEEVFLDINCLVGSFGF